MKAEEEEMIKNEWLIVTVVGTLVRMILFMLDALPKERNSENGFISATNSDIMYDMSRKKR